jgi:pimeloyl-ACP methyl ester carboxylesterase
MAAICLLSCPASRACGADKDETKKTKEYDDVKFDTVDQVEIHGRFYAGAGKKKAATVMVLTKLGGDIRQDGWDRLAEALKKEGYSVLLFDFRGCGDSKNISPDFWKVANNVSSIKGGPGNPVKSTIDFKDFSKSYYPALINDIAAARVFLDRRNDAGECNSSDLILIGAEDGAALGMAWIYSEWYRFRLDSIGKLDSGSEGKEVAGCVWLSFRRSLGSNYNVPEEWFRHVGREKKTPMAFVSGDGDRSGEELGQSWVNFIKKKDTKGDQGSKLTGFKPIEKADKVTGSELLQKNLKTQDWIIEYIGKVMEGRGNSEWTQREVKKNAYVWTFPNSALRIPAKPRDSETISLAPMQMLFR